MSPETNAPELLSDDRPLDTADTEPPPPSAVDTTEPPPAVASTTPPRPRFIQLIIAEARRCRDDVTKGDPSRLAEMVLELLEDEPYATRAALARKANEIGDRGRYRGAPHLTADSSLETLIRWHQWNDPNGCYSAVQCELEGFDPPTVERMWELLAEIES